MTTNTPLRTDGGAQVDDAPAVSDTDAPAPNYENPETAAKLRERAQEQVDEKKQQAKEAQSVKHQLEQAAKEETISVSIFEEKDLKVEFSTLSTNEATRLMGIAQTFESIDSGSADLDESEMVGRFREMTDSISEILAENAIDDSLQDPDWWGDTLSLMRLITVGRGLIAEDDSLDPEEVQEFR